MRHSSPITTLLIITLGSLLTPSGFAQSLGDAARQARKNKPAEPTTKVITNDDISSSSSRTTDTLYNTHDSSPETSAKPENEKKKSDSAAEAQDKLDKAWKERFAAQKDSIATLEKELANLQRDVQSRASNFYGDAGTRLRNEAKYAEDDRKSRDAITAKQKQLDDAKIKLEQMKEEARKAGASPGAIG